MLPARTDIDVHGSLDEAIACKHFLGKTLDDVVAMLEAASLARQEDLMWMGPRAFAFYLPAVTRYLASDAARGDDAFLSSLLKSLDFQRQSGGFALARDEIRRLANVVVRQYENYGVDEAVYGDLRAAYVNLGRELEQDAGSRRG